MSHFGGYAEYAVAPAFLTAQIGYSTPVGEATALTVQYCTAYFAAAEIVHLFAGDRVLIHAAAGGVGTALLQYAKIKECEIFATAGSPAKLSMIREEGANHAIDYKTQDFEKEILKITGGKGLDVIFDSLGGATTKKGMRLLAPGGRIVCYGAADVSGRSLFGKLAFLTAFGFYHPLRLMSGSRAILGLNMLRIAENKPAAFKRTLEQVITLYNHGVFRPAVGHVFKVSEIAAAHDLLESRRSTGKIAVLWQ
jgi:NADPH2:quinone reductase